MSSVPLSAYTGAYRTSTAALSTVSAHVGPKCLPRGPAGTMLLESRRPRERMLVWCVLRRAHEVPVAVATPPRCTQASWTPHCVSALSASCAAPVETSASECHARSRRQPQRTGCHDAMLTCRQHQHPRVCPGITTTHDASGDDPRSIGPHRIQCPGHVTACWEC